MHTAKIRQVQYIATLLFFSLFLFPPQPFAQDGQQPATKLVPILHPQLEGVEKVVREQLEEARDNVEAIVNNPEANEKLKALTYGNLGHLYHAYDYLDAALAAYKNAATLQPDVYRWNYCVAFVLQKLGNYPVALDYYKHARQMDVSSELMYLVNLRIGECYQGMNELENANNAYLIARTLSPQGPAILARLGELRLSQKKFKEATEFLHLALTYQPDANKLYYPLAMAYRGLGDREKAKAYLDRRGVVGVQPPDPLKEKLDSLLKGFRIHRLEGKSAFNAGRYVEAADFFKKALAADPMQASGWIDLGTANGKLGKYEEAKSNYQEALRLDPTNITAYYNMGDILLAIGSNQEAIPYLTKVVEATPADAEAHLKLARAYRDSMKFNEAIESYKKSLELDYTNPSAWLELIEIFEHGGAHKFAIASLELANKKLPMDTAILSRLAYSLAASPDREARDGQKALEYAERLFRMDSSYLTARLVGMAYAELNQCDQAAMWFERTLSMAQVNELKEESMEVLQRNLDYVKTTSPCRIP